jgi:hypothetical protein
MIGWAGCSMNTPGAQRDPFSVSHTDAQLVGAAGEAVRHAVYGIVLWLTYPELLARQWAPLQAAQREPRPDGAP